MKILSNFLLFFNKTIEDNNITKQDDDKHTAVTLLSNLEQVVFQISPSSKWTFLNNSWKQLTGFSVNETLGTRLLDYVHPKGRPNVEVFLQQQFQQSAQADKSIVVRFLSKTNNSIHTILRANTILKNNNEEIKSIIGTITDVAEIMHEQNILNAKYRSLRNFVDNYSGMLYRCRNDQALTIEYASSGCLELTGYSYEQLVKNNEATYISIIHPDDRQRIMETIQYKLPDGKNYQLTHRITTADETERWVLNIGQGVYSSSGELLSFEGSLIDFDKQKQIQKLDQKYSLYDPDTKFLNEILFIDRLEHAIEIIKSRKNYTFALLLLSIDQHTQILESLGLTSADFLMTEIGLRIFEDLNQPISMCKLLNTQFGILIDSSEYSIKNITKVINQIQEQVQAPLSIDENEIFATASIGVVIGHQKHTDSSSVLLEAQNALSRAASLGGARYEVSDLITHGRAALQSHMDLELEQALEEDKFLVHWQPIVTIKDNKLIGLEARLAWPHPIKGLLYAEKFVPDSDDTQLITPLWEWMLNDAYRQIQNWNNSISGIEKLALNIQVTGASLLDADSIFRLREKLLSVKPEQCNLIVGVSENVLSHAPRTTDSILKPMKGKDIQLLLDGYGHDKTSLHLLEKMPIDFVRLNPILIENCVKDRGKFISAIVSLMHGLNISVIANGVETDNQLNILNEANIDIAQGSFISIPQTENATRDILIDSLNT
ncbi:MAG: EAL domain-containing protein [Gammaproteobacteria bacterium]|nr:MAG: EAL domain-containing protein [Gammaproteobacteria bacterium]